MQLPHSRDVFHPETGKPGSGAAEPGRTLIDTDECVIVGVTLEGQAFRPEDWAERLCRVLAPFGGEPGAPCSPYVRPIVAGGVKSVVVDARLTEIDARAYRFVMRFARDNELTIRPGRAFDRKTVPD